MTRQFYTYIMTNKNNSVLYTGVAHDLAGRVWQHKEGTNEGFTKWYNLHKLVYYETFEDVNTAIVREKQIKGWLRARKIELVETENQNWEDLSADWYDD